MTKVLIRIVSILILFIAIGWDGNLNHIRKNETVMPHRNYLRYDEALNTLTHPIYKENNYYYQKVYITTHSRTLIPFKYKKDGSKVEKKYYSEGRH